MAIVTKGTCSDCTVAKGTLPFGVNQIGATVEVDLGKEWTKYTFYQCPKCGSLWQETRDGGASGHGRFYKRLTAADF